MKKTNLPIQRLTDAELEFMNILWGLGEGSVNDVLAALPPERELAYTSVSTILRILEQKGVLKARKEGRGHIYQPRFDKAKYEALAVKDVLERVFNNTPVSLVRQLVNTVDLTPEEVAELKKLLSAKEKP